MRGLLACDTRRVSIESPLASSYRILRSVAAPADSPWPGVLASAPGAGSVLLVDAELLPDDWPGWRAARDGHVLGPADIVRRADGHDVALPVCTERLSDFLMRRAATPLSAGERLTLAVSVARGAHELAAGGADADCPGTWWLTEGGQPMLAAHEGGESAVRGSSGVLSALLDGAGRMAEPIEELIAALTDPALLAHTLPRIEERLFGLADPEPLATAVLAPRRVRDLDGRTQDLRPATPGHAERTGLGQTLARHIDADFADLLSRVTTGLWRRVQSAPTGRSRRPIIVSLCIAAAVLAAGLMWPAGGEGPATAEVPAHAATDAATLGATDAATLGATETPITTAPAPLDLAAVTSDLLAERIACAGDDACLAGILEDPSAVTAAGAIDLPTDQRTVTLLDDFGGAAVLRVEPVTAGPVAQLVLVIRTDGKWLLRDVHDIAEQP